MCIADPELGALHITAIYALAEYLVAHCPDRYTSDLNDRINLVLDTFERFRSPHSSRTTADKESLGKFRDGLAQNYITAQVSILMAFVHQLSRLLEQRNFDEMTAAIARLWQQLSKCYESFFGTGLHIALEYNKEK